MKSSRHRAWALAAMALPFFGCSKPNTPSSGVTATSSETPVTVTVAPVKTQTLNWTIEQPGAVYAFESTPLVAKLPGFVSEVRKDLGDPIEAGEVLAVIDIPELVQESQQKKAAVAEASAAAVQAAKGIDVAVQQIATAEALASEAKSGLTRTTADFERWEKEHKRIEGLVADKVVDRQTLDEVLRQFRSATAAKEEASAKTRSAEAAIKEAEAKKGRAVADHTAALARVKSAEAEANRLLALLTYREIRAPYKGIVTGRFVHTGHFLQPATGKAEPVFTVARLDVVRVFVEVPESSANQASVGTKAIVKFPALAKKEWPATITRSAHVLTPESRTLRTEIDLPNPNGELRPGLYAIVKILATKANAITVPHAAVLYADETAYVYAVENGKVVKLRVQTGLSDTASIELLGQKKASVMAGEFQPFTGTEKVAVGNLGSLADGQAIAIKE